MSPATLTACGYSSPPLFLTLPWLFGLRIMYFEFTPSCRSLSEQNRAAHLFNPRLFLGVLGPLKFEERGCSVSPTAISASILVCQRRVKVGVIV